MKIFKYSFVDIPYERLFDSALRLYKQLLINDELVDRNDWTLIVTVLQLQYIEKHFNGVYRFGENGIRFLGFNLDVVDIEAKYSNDNTN